MFRGLPALLLLLTACAAPVAQDSPAGSQSPGAAGSPVGESSPSPVASTSTDGTSSASPLPPTLNCSLPIGTPDGASGFLHFPGGSLEPALGPRAAIAEIGGYYTQTYDWAYAKWLPVGPADISPDGSRYVYQGNDRVLKSVDVVTGTISPIPSSIGWNLIAAETDGVYVHTFLGRTGLWFLRYDGGDPVQVSTTGYSYLAVGGIYAYASAGKDDQTLLQVNLKTGTTTKFADPPAQILGFTDSWVPVVRLASSLVLMPAPYQQTVIVPDQAPPGFVVGDLNGIWFPLSDGIYLGTPDGRVTQVSPRNGLIEGSCR
jgi:hypothetical protein